MGVLDQILDENTFAYDQNEYEGEQGIAQSYDEQGFNPTLLRRRMALKTPQTSIIPRQTIVPSATPQNPMSVGARANVPMAKAQFDITILRSDVVDKDGKPIPGQTFTEALPIVLFASSQIKSHYKNVLINNSSAQYLGVVGGNIYRNVTGASDDGLNQYPTNAHRFIFKVGDDRYVYIDVLCNQNPYPSLLSALESDISRINYLKYFVQDASQIAQYNKKFNYIEASLFGKTSNDGVPVLSNVKATDQKDTIVELPLSLWIDKTKGFLFEVGGESTNKPITLSFFVDYAQRQNV